MTDGFPCIKEYKIKYSPSPKPQNPIIAYLARWPIKCRRKEEIFSLFVPEKGGPHRVLIIPCSSNFGWAFGWRAFPNPTAASEEEEEEEEALPFGSGAD